MKAPIDWLLQGEPWIEYRTRRDLLGQAESEAQVKRARKAMLADARVKALVTELKRWPGTVIASHRSAGQPFHKLTFLADLGLRSTDAGVDVIVKNASWLTERRKIRFNCQSTSPRRMGAAGERRGRGPCATRP